MDNEEAENVQIATAFLRRSTETSSYSKLFNSAVVEKSGSFGNKLRTSAVNFKNFKLNHSVDVVNKENNFDSISEALYT